MSMTYTWEITSLKTQNQTNADGATLANAVVQTYWKKTCLLYTSPSPRDRQKSRMPSSA